MTASRGSAIENACHGRVTHVTSFGVVLSMEGTGMKCMLHSKPHGRHPQTLPEGLDLVVGDSVLVSPGGDDGRVACRLVPAQHKRSALQQKLPLQQPLQPCMGQGSGWSEPRFGSRRAVPEDCYHTDERTVCDDEEKSDPDEDWYEDDIVACQHELKSEDMESDLPPLEELEFADEWLGFTDSFSEEERQPVRKTSWNAQASPVQAENSDEAEYLDDDVCEEEVQELDSQSLTEEDASIEELEGAAWDDDETADEDGGEENALTDNVDLSFGDEADLGEQEPSREAADENFMALDTTRHTSSEARRVDVTRVDQRRQTSAPTLDSRENETAGRVDRKGRWGGARLQHQNEQQLIRHHVSPAEMQLRNERQEKEDDPEVRKEEEVEELEDEELEEEEEEEDDEQIGVSLWRDQEDDDEEEADIEWLDEEEVDWVDEKEKEEEEEQEDTDKHVDVDVEVDMDCCDTQTSSFNHHNRGKDVENVEEAGHAEIDAQYQAGVGTWQLETGKRKKKMWHQDNAPLIAPPGQRIPGMPSPEDVAKPHSASRSTQKVVQPSNPQRRPSGTEHPVGRPIKPSEPAVEHKIVTIQKSLDCSWRDSKGDVYEFEFSKGQKWNCWKHHHLGSKRFSVKLDMQNLKLWWGSTYVMNVARLSGQNVVRWFHINDDKIPAFTWTRHDGSTMSGHRTPAGIEAPPAARAAWTGLHGSNRSSSKMPAGSEEPPAAAAASLSEFPTLGAASELSRIRHDEQKKAKQQEWERQQQLKRQVREQKRQLAEAAKSARASRNQNVGGNQRAQTQADFEHRSGLFATMAATAEKAMPSKVRCPASKSVKDGTVIAADARQDFAHIMPSQSAKVSSAASRPTRDDKPDEANADPKNAAFKHVKAAEMACAPPESTTDAKKIDVKADSHVQSRRANCNASKPTADVREIIVNAGVQPDSRPHVHVAMLGSRGVGKSMLCGSLLREAGAWDERLFNKHRRECEKEGICESRRHEEGETSKIRFTLLDVPGGRNCLPEAVGAISSADICVVVVSAKGQESEAARSEVSQSLREQILLCRGLGVQRLIVAVSKMSEVKWAQENFETVRTALLPVICEHELTASFAPVDGLSGQIGTHKAPWFSGKPLLEQLEEAASANSRSSDDTSSLSARLLVKSVLRGKGGIITACGRIECGSIRPGMNCIVAPIQSSCTVQAVLVRGTAVASASVGEAAEVHLAGLPSGAAERLRAGAVVADAHAPVRTVAKLKAELDILQMPDRIPVLTVGFKGMLHIHAATVDFEIAKLLQATTLSTGETEHKPRSIKVGQTAVVILQLQQDVAAEEFCEGHGRLGLLALRVGDATVAVGRVQELAKEQIGRSDRDAS